MTMLRLLFVMLVLGTAYPSFASEKFITVELIDKMGGIVHVLMPCTWRKGTETLSGQYKGSESYVEMKRSRLDRSGRYLIMTVAKADMNGLIESRFEYQEDD
jgi:hypothetical protein